MITANQLSDGAVVYLGPDQSWTGTYSDGLVVADEKIDAQMEIAEQAVQDCVVVAPYAIAIEKDGTTHRPVRFREQIRAQGPTVRAGRDA